MATRNYLRYVFTALFLAFSAVALPVFAAGPQAVKLTFGTYDSDQPAELHNQFKGILNYLESTLTKEIGKPVNIQMRIFQSYDAGRQAIITETIDLARLGAASYVLAKSENPKLKAFVIEEQKGGHIKKGVIFARKDSGIKTIADIKGKAFAFGDTDSTTGRYTPQAYLVDAGVTAKDLKRMAYLERHQNVCNAVLSGEFDVGTSSGGRFRKNKDRSPGLVEIVSFDALTKPWVAAGSLDPKIFAALTKILVNLKDEDILASMGGNITGFIPIDDAAFASTKEAIEKAKKFGGDPSLAAKQEVKK